MKIDRSRLALGSYQYFRYPFQTFLDTAVQLEISQVELWGAAPHLFLHGMPPIEMKTIANQMRERQLQVCAITPEQCKYPFNVASDHRRLREHTAETFQSAIQLAQELNCPKVLFSTGTGYWDESPAEGLKRSLDFVIDMAQYAKSRGVHLILETLTPLSSNLIHTPQEVMAYITALGQENVHSMVDLGQVCYMNQQLQDYKILGTELTHVHLHDYGAAIHMALGDGNAPVEDWISEIESWGYTGTYSLELNDPRYQNEPAKADIQSVTYLETRGILG